MVTTTPIYHPLSHSGLKVPKLWLSAMMFGDQTSEAEARNIVDAPAQPRRRILRPPSRANTRPMRASSKRRTTSRPNNRKVASRVR